MDESGQKEEPKGRVGVLALGVAGEAYMTTGGKGGGEEVGGRWFLAVRSSLKLCSLNDWPLWDCFRLELLRIWSCWQAYQLLQATLLAATVPLVHPTSSSCLATLRCLAVPVVPCQDVPGTPSEDRIGCGREKVFYCWSSCEADHYSLHCYTPLNNIVALA